MTMTCRTEDLLSDKSSSRSLFKNVMSPHLRTYFTYHILHTL
uniref:Uncharacterized protein n=1 Tax=Lepeophtheirus salmonis TaxID=72036 RepID=A0A0K2U0Z2_LEPSM